MLGILTDKIQFNQQSIFLLKNCNELNKTTTNKKLIIEDQTLLLILDMQEKLITNIDNIELILFNIKIIWMKL